MKKIGFYIRPTSGLTESEQRIRLQGTDCEELAIEILENDVGFLRPGFESLMDMVQTGGVSTIVVSRLDRLDLICGTEAEFLDFFRILADNGVRFISIDENLDSNFAAGIFFGRLGRAIRAAREIVRGERIRISLSRSKEEGIQLGRPRTTDHAKILEFRRQGFSIQEIAERVGASRGAVQYCLKTAENTDVGPA